MMKKQGKEKRPGPAKPYFETIKLLKSAILARRYRRQY